MADALGWVAGSAMVRNALLASLAQEDFLAISPHLESTPTASGTVLIRSGEPIEWVYFPQSSTLSIHERGGASTGIEVGLVGFEGMLGWSVLLGCSIACHTGSVCRSENSLLRLPASALLAACRERPSLGTTLLRYVHVMTVQMSRLLVSQLHDPFIRRLSRWLLMRHDRVVGDELEVRHEEIGTSLDVRRASVTDGLHILEGEHLVRCFRGRVIIRDRGRLEAWADDAYGGPEALYRSLIGPFGKVGSSAQDVGADLTLRSSGASGSAAFRREQECKRDFGASALRLTT